MFEVKEAKREASPVLAAFIGQSGSGKTLSALLMMRGIVGPAGKIVVIDTEGGRALIYADDPEVGGFHHIDFVGPWSSDRFREALKAAIAAGADGIIIDSASHEHEAEGGMLDFADSEERRGQKGRAKWIKPKMAHGRYITAVKSAPCHVILCIREKIIIDIDAKPAVKVFLPSCDRDLPFEMALTIRLEPETHKATFIKVPKPFLAHVKDGMVVTAEHGRLLMAEAGKGTKINIDSRAIIAELEAAADNGADALRLAYAAAWKANGPADNKVLSPTRIEIQKNAERLKRIAAEADALAKARAANPDQFPGDPPADPSEIGTIAPIVPPDFDNLQEGEGELFKPEDKSDF